MASEETTLLSIKFTSLLEKSLWHISYHKKLFNRPYLIQSVTVIYWKVMNASLCNCTYTE